MGRVLARVLATFRGEQIKKGDKRGAQALRGAREATGAAKASKKGDKREKKERKNDDFGR